MTTAPTPPGSDVTRPGVRVLVLAPGDEAAQVRYVDAEDPDTMQRLVGGWLEAVMLASDAVAYLNEEGRMLALDDNVLAARLLSGVLPPDETVVGTVVVVGLDEAPDGFGGLVSVDVPDSVRSLCEQTGVPVSE